MLGLFWLFVINDKISKNDCKKKIKNKKIYYYLNLIFLKLINNIDNNFIINNLIKIYVSKSK